jgi:hypothetical protein
MDYGLGGCQWHSRPFILAVLVVFTRRGFSDMKILDIMPGEIGEICQAIFFVSPKRVGISLAKWGRISLYFRLELCGKYV